jgi:hypothetical protein
MPRRRRVCRQEGQIFFSVCPLSGQHRRSLTGAVPPVCRPVPCSTAAAVCHGLAGNPSVSVIRPMDGEGGGGPWLGMASRLRSVCRRIVSRADKWDAGDGTPVTGCARTPLPPRVECVHAAGKTCFAQGPRRCCWSGMDGSAWGVQGRQGSAEVSQPCCKHLRRAPGLWHRGARPLKPLEEGTPVYEGRQSTIMQPAVSAFLRHYSSR